MVAIKQLDHDAINQPDREQWRVLREDLLNALTRRGRLLRS